MLVFAFVLPLTLDAILITHENVICGGEFFVLLITIINPSGSYAGISVIHFSLIKLMMGIPAVIWKIMTPNRRQESGLK